MANWLSGLGNLFSSGMSGLGSAFSKPISQAGNYLSNMFGGGQQGSSFGGPSQSTFTSARTPYSQLSSYIGGGGQYTPSQGAMSRLPYGSMSLYGGGGASSPQVSGNALSKMFSSKWAMPAAGVGLMGLSQMIKNPGMPNLPPEYQDYLKMAMGGGNPYMQQAGSYYQGLMSGDQNNEYLRSILFPIEESETEEQRQMDAMYKSLRPGTDPMTDSTYQKDKQKLSQKYAETKRRAVAQAKYGAASGMAGFGGMLGTMAGQALQPQLEMLAAQWGMNASQKQQLRDVLLQGGMGLATAPIQSQQFLNQLAAMKEAGIF